MKIYTLSLLLALSLLLSQTHNIRAADAGRIQAVKGPMPNKLWQVGDTWNLLIEIYPGPSLYDSSDAIKKWAEVGYLPPSYHFVMQVKIAGMETVRDVACWQIDFTPQEDGTNNSKPAKIRASIGKEDGLLHNLVNLSREKDADLNWTTLGHFTIFYFPIEYFPTVFMPAATEENLEVHPDQSAWCLNVESQWQDKDHKEFFQEQRLRRVGPDGRTIWQMNTVRQHWIMGAKWWHQYEQRNEKRVVLRATLLPDASAPQAARTIPLSKDRSKSGGPAVPPPPRINDIYSDMADDINHAVPFSPASNYMSMPGNLRYRFFGVSGYFMSRQEAYGILIMSNSLDDTLRRMGEFYRDKAKRSQ